MSLTHTHSHTECHITTPTANFGFSVQVLYSVIGRPALEVLVVPNFFIDGNLQRGGTFPRSVL